MPIVIVDGREIEIGQQRLNGIQAARLAGVEIPHYCWHPGLTVVGSCRMCLVETGTRDAKTGRVSMFPKLVPACATPAKDGTVFVTNSEKVQRAREMVEEDLLLRHPVDCPICDKAGECSLQDFHFRYGRDERRADIHPYTSRRRDVGDNITLFVDRCVLCSRCVRFTREISGTSELMLSHRGSHEEIDVMPGFPLENELSGNVVDLCPVGALCDKDFLYRQRVWFMRKHAGICTGCATGCAITVEENQDRVYRIKPRENSLVNQWWICNEGRYGYPHVHDDRRLAAAKRRQAGAEAIVDWQGLAGELKKRLAESGPLAGVVSPFLTVEEAYLFIKALRSIDPAATLVLGPVPTVGEDKTFANGFTIRAEKCPNRRGVERLLAHFAGKVQTLDDVNDALAAGKYGAVWFTGGYRQPWITAEAAGRIRAKLLVVQDLFPSPLAERADYELPAAAFAEKEGSYVNCDDRLQCVERAIRPPAGVRSEASLFWEMLGRTGLYQARAVLDDVAREVIYFAAAAGPVPPVGIDMKVNLLAENGATPATA